MATKNIEINIKNSTNTYDQLYPKTNSSNIIMSGGENLDEYISSDRQYKVGDTLTTARPSSDFNNEWMVCDGSEVPSGYNINSLLNEDDTFNKAPNKQTTSFSYNNFTKNIKEQNGVVGIVSGTYFYYTINMIGWKRIDLTSYFSGVYGSYFYYDLNLEKHVIIGGIKDSGPNFGKLSLFSVEGFENNNITIQKLKEFSIDIGMSIGEYFSDGRKIFIVSQSYNNESFQVRMVDSKTEEIIEETIENDEAGIRKIQDCFIINNKRYLIINNFSTNSPTTYSWVIVIGENSFIKNISIPYPSRKREITSSLINGELYIKTIEKYYKIDVNDNLVEIKTNFPSSGKKIFLEYNSKIYLFDDSSVYVGEDVLEYNKQYKILDETISTIYSSIKVFLNNFYYLGFCATNRQTYITLYYYKMSCFLPDSPNNPTGLTTMIKVN